MERVKIALLGYGNAGRAFTNLLLNKKDEIKKCYGAEVIVTAISTRSKGTLIDHGGIDLVQVGQELDATSKFADGQQIESIEVVKTADYDVLFELTPLDIETGQPAIQHIEEAFKRGKHVVSANKGPIAWDFDRLNTMAANSGSLFFYETTVMDGTPIFNLADETLKMCKVTEIVGILNSTTNFILEEMAKKKPMDEIMEEGRKRGFVEADPSMDIEGWDAAAKVTALMNVLMKANITPMDIERTGIEGITYDDIKTARKKGKLIKLVCGGKVEGDTVHGYVKPMELDESDLLATISGTSSAVSISTDLMGTVTIVEHEPEIEQTAYGVFGDLLRVLSRI